jgi:hypothetical protein
MAVSRNFLWALLLTLVGIACAVAVWRGAERRAEMRASVTDAVQPPGAADDIVPPPLPAVGAVDTLIGLVTVPPESLPRFEVRESDYEVKAVTVYGQRGDWFLVGVSDGGRSWIHARAAGVFVRAESLVVNGLTYLTPAWDHRVRETADPGSPGREVVLPRDFGAEIPARVLRAIRSGDVVSLQVEVFDRSPCAAPEDPGVIATGWIPMWSPNGKPTTWFYSRGC